VTGALADLLDALGAAPTLPGARCRGRWELFDATIHESRGALPDEVTYARQAALQLCVTCPALAACTTWVESLPPRQRPHGAIAGRVRTSQPARARKEKPDA